MIPEQELTGADLPAGAQHYRAFVGPPANYDLIAAMQFNLLTRLGLRDSHYLLDIGCGSLRGGRLFIPYLLPGRYHGIEPEAWLIEEGINKELGRDIIELKKPLFSQDNKFNLSVFNREFDFLLAQSIFTHASSAQMDTCLAQARRVMHEKSVFAATFISGDINYEGDAWVYPQIITYTPEYVDNLAQRNGLRSTIIDWPHPMVAQSRWVLFTDPGYQPAPAVFYAANPALNDTKQPNRSGPFKWPASLFR